MTTTKGRYDAPEPTPEPNTTTLFMRLQDSEDFASASCGCILQRSPKAGMNACPEFLRCSNCERAVNSQEQLVKSVKELRECLSNWMEIAEPEDERDYDKKAIKNADSAIAKAEGK